MPIERAPYLIYSEQVGTVNYNVNSGADSLVIIAPTKIAKFTSTGEIEKEPLYTFTVYSENAGTTLVGTCTCKETGTESDGYKQYEVITSDTNTITAGTKYYLISTAKTDESVIYELYTNAGTTSANKFAKVYSEQVTKWYEPTITDDEILAFNRYSLAEQLIKDEELLSVLKDFFIENNYYSAQGEMGVNSVFIIPLPTETVGSGNNAVAHPNVDDFKNAYKLLRKYRKVTAVGVVGLANPQPITVTLRQYLGEDQLDGVLRIAYIQAPQRNTNETIVEYATRIYNLSQAHTVGTGNDATSEDGANSSRIAFIEPKHYGKLLARICNTEYYIEPGYLPVNSVSVGEFEALSPSERDILCMSGLIFGEDDVLLPTTTPRICLGTASSFSRKYNAGTQTFDNTETRPADALLHARRNADHHVREVLNILAYQLKRNETSVTLRYVKNEVMSYFENELNKGTIMAYSFNVEESNYNPYCLLVTGAIVPVNSTLAIEFSNYIGAPYTVASDYV